MQEHTQHNERLKQYAENPLSNIRSICKRSLYKFVQTMWSEYTTDPFQPNWHIEYICGELEKVARGVANKQPKKHDLIINVPPGTSKTSVVMIMFPVWCWVNWYWMRFITASYSSALSLESAEYSRDIMRSYKFKQLFPEIEIKLDKDTKSNYRIIRKEWKRAHARPRIHHGGNRYSTSVGGTLTGFHGHILLWDDALDPNRAVSENALNSANRWISDTLSTRKVNKSVTPMIGIMQRLHQNDPPGYLLAKGKENVKHICLPGEIRNYKEQVRPQELVSKYNPEGLLDPVRMDWSVLQELEADLGQYGYAGQIGQRPTPPGGGMFKVEAIPTVTSPLESGEILRSVRYWDKGGSSRSGAYSVGVLVHLTSARKFLIADVKRGQWSSEQRERIIRSVAEADGQKVTVYVEQEPGSGGKESAENTIRNLAGFKVFADRPTGSKEFRADPFSVQVNNGNVQILRADWNKEFLDELRYFPHGKYADQVDAASGAFAMLTKKKMVKVL